MRLITFARYLLVIAGIACGVVYAPPVRAEGSGYEGLIAPATPDDASKDAAQANTDESPGYAGLVSGSTPEATPQFTPIPGFRTVAPGSHQDAKTLAAIRGRDRDGDGVPDSITASKKIALTGLHAQVKGKSAAEYTVEQNIARVMSSIEDPKIPPNVRTENARQAYADLTALATGLRYKQMVPDKTYQKMGLSDSYIQGEKAGNENALAQLDKTLAALKPYQ